jgi:putative salt-induced outer membrane protein YdiY
MRTARSIGVVRVLLVVVAATAPNLAAAQSSTATPAQPPPVRRPAPPPPPPARPPEPPGWAGSLGAGLAVTSGNAATSTVNIAYELMRDRGGELVFRTTGLYLRAETDGEPSVDRAAADIRLDYRLTERLALVGLTTYARDRFKNIEMLLAPTAGLSVTVLPAGRVEWIADGSVGLVAERNTLFRTQASAAVLAGERFTYRINDRARILHAASGLWKTEDFGDAYYTLSAGVATSLAARFELKAEFLNTHKRKVTDPGLRKNDQAIVLSIVYKF